MADNKWYISDKKSDAPWTEHEYFYDDVDFAYRSQVDKTYDASGRLISSRDYTQDFIDNTVYTYDDNGTLLSSTTTAGEHLRNSCTYDGNGNLITRQNYDWYDGAPTDLYQYSYDKNGNKASETCYLDGVLAEVNTYSYDSNGNKIEAVCFNSAGQSSADKYIYDAEGRMISEEYYNASGDFDGSYSYKYDGNGHLIERSYTNSDKEVNEVITYHWNDNGQKDQAKWVRKPWDEDWDKATEWTQSYRYDKEGNVVGIDLYEDKRQYNEQVYAYDANGNRTIEEYYRYDRDSGEKSLTTKTEYGYDDTGVLVGTWDYNSNGTLNKHWTAKEMTFGGQVYTFNAKELLNIVTSLGSSSTNFSSVLSSIASTCGSIAGTVSSADSNLSGTLNRLADVCNTCDTQISKLLTNLSNDINNYITKTVAQEEEASQQLADINYDLWKAEEAMKKLSGE